MSILDAVDDRPVHFMGIAGAGMRALAELFVRRGIRVGGCDAVAEDVDDLRALGIRYCRRARSVARSGRARGRGDVGGSREPS